MTLRSLTPHELSQFTGTEFRDRYRLTRLISCGANGAVYEAADLRFEGSRVAVKLALSVYSESEFEKEAKLLRQLDRQPGVVGVSDYGVQDGIPFIVMDYLEGQSLYELFKRYDRKLPFDLVTKFVDEVGAALRGAHSKNVIHRDLKPQNVLLVDTSLVDDNGQTVQRFVLVDFGIASKIDAKATMLNRTMAGLGTPEYRSPEQIKAKDDSPSTDIYTFGVVLFEMLTGRVPFPARSGSDADLGRLYIAIEEQPPPSLSEVAPDRDIDPEIEKLVLQCLEKDPARRPQSIGEVRRRYLEIAAPSRRPGDTAVPYIGTLQPGLPGVPRGDTVVNTAASATRWKTIVPSVFGPWPAAVLAIAAAGLLLAFAYKFVAPPPAWNPDPARFETRGAAAVRASLGGRPYRLAPRLVRKVRGLPAGEEAVFVLVHRPRSHGGGKSDFYILRDKVWYDLYAAFVDEARKDPEHVGLAECRVTLEDVEHPLKERDKSFPADLAPADERAKWPVTNISPNAAYCFCRWLVPQGGRLPSLTEWWTAAGYDPQESGRVGPFRGSGEKVAVNRKTPAPVGTHDDDANSEPFGCNDVAGNGYEWTCTSEIGTNCLAEITTSDVVGFPLTSQGTGLIRVGQKFDETEPLHFPGCPEIPDRQPDGAYADIGFRVMFEPADSP